MGFKANDGDVDQTAWTFLYYVRGMFEMNCLLSSSSISRIFQNPEIIFYHFLHVLNLDIF